MFYHQLNFFSHRTCGRKITMTENDVSACRF